ncbi:MAG: heme biosynthesis protein HemY [Alphaproteobacteria bacterium RIFCSPLOWO2_01_FULL_40_26]|nr:MAG: heme biosynthesis protein HemY [Alphaproteobacteria bacterium RIFCSPHIGHO2_02_FULL_40_34]OFW88458.1 MAG: heme biosynthesis protein HemY [Alphaproteobacteria bacterium RIFCSPHIGHO2_01_FULL_40_8]OFW94834.1 MAG: heme biosynthesis protein HemY [Alphaproteobacteria bacterium RIFCSPLOWO2_01_FULL_40_26]OFX10460.1 MAG: heme biosynthesis protein HemY [Alphaproteobacteria bacterium RIFCSPLOWO2_02_FULL_40_19]OFX11034.1 MAG: heme biosynthesis protein HemY [Alphaproteobacteria bacterium RIFCSPLOWO2_
MNSITLSNTALARINEIKQKPENREKFLRISVSGGGCSGFQYVFELDGKRHKDDVEIVKNIAITDETSLPFLNGAEIEFVKELGASYFKVNNPNAKAKCGCGSSFSV